jgi:altronate dehydratase
VPASHIKVGLECGGSDGFSGITANPALGAAMDILVRHGGTAILSETPEIHGVEYMLTRRAVTPEVGRSCSTAGLVGRNTRAATTRSSTAWSARQPGRAAWPTSSRSRWARR